MAQNFLFLKNQTAFIGENIGLLDQPQERGFSRAVAADEGAMPIFFQSKIHIPKQLPLGEAKGQVFCCNHGKISVLSSVHTVLS